MSLTQRLISGMLLLVALLTAVALAALRALRHAGMPPQSLHHATLIAIIAIVAAVGIAIGVTRAVLRPLRRSADQLRAIGQGNLDQRIEWSGDDSLGELATEVNRMAVHVRDLRETEFGRKQMEH